MSEKREYTAADFDRRLAINDDDDSDLVRSALRIASAVMKPGVIEIVLADSQNWPKMSDAIRKALLGEAGAGR